MEFKYMAYLALVIVIIVLLSFFPTMQNVINSAGLSGTVASLAVVLYFVNIAVMLFLGIMFAMKGSREG
jgi:glucan phosphoethanolaminetransferase (alkaline phosphatase superfamily)